MGLVHSYSSSPKDQIAPALKIIFRKSLDEGKVPEEWRSANVTPIFKKGTKTDPSNYRPVSLTSVCCKLMESLLRDSVSEHMEKNGLLEDSQNGFVSGRSCTTNLIDFLDFVTETIDSGDSVDIVFLDFTKAFEKVPRQCLIEKLKANGVGGKIVTWIDEWLKDRKPRVVINGHKSNWNRVGSGVPQGSVLGPLLFLMFIGDLDSKASAGTKLRKFADDTKLGQKISNNRDNEELQKSLDEMMDWARTWSMEFNIGKCKVMHVGSRNPRFAYTMENQQLEVTEEEKDIRVQIPRTLKPSAQCMKAAKTATSVLEQITRSFKDRDKKVFISLFKRYVRPHLEFAVEAWSPWLQKDIEVLEKVQQRAVKQVRGMTSNDYAEQLRDLDLPSLVERRREADMVHGLQNIARADRTEKQPMVPKNGREHGQGESSSGRSSLKASSCTH
jgi:Reverse transcriptase (RNA-dependent DNA polymerase)